MGGTLVVTAGEVLAAEAVKTQPVVVVAAAPRVVAEEPAAPVFTGPRRKPKLARN